ncbi:uncharacterized protein [Enoplosus armatus]|uniref:uncharacterized protein n=1 Tax=Enoplosus armatus TaxID=215367 RepID=UPI0039933197
MSPPSVALYLSCLFVVNMGKLCFVNAFHVTTLKQSALHFESVNVGENVTMPCFCEDDVAVMFYWYKQPVGQKPKLLSTFYRHNDNGIFHDEFEDNPRFSLDTENRKNHLKISDLQSSDSATYYCVGSNLDFEFCEGTTVSVKGSGLNIQALVHQSASETIRPGGSVTLDCTVHTGSCDGEHSVYWFKKSGESHPGLIYTHGGRNDTCVYNLPMKRLNVSHAGTSYCAVASCGHILFGDGTKLDFEDEVDSFVLVYFFGAALAFTTVLVVLLAFTVCKMSKGNCQCTESTVTATSTPATVDEENLHYAAVRDLKANRTRRQGDNTKSECVYSSVRQQDRGIQAEKMMVWLLSVPLLWSVCEARLSDVSQAAAFQAVEPGHAVTLACRIHSAVRTRVWYKLNTGRRLRLVASTDALYNLTTFEEQSHRYSVKSDNFGNDLTISATMWEDIGTYYCGVMQLNDIQFGQGTFLTIKGAKMISDSVAQRPESKTVQPGDSVTLSCSVHTGHCAAEHIGVMWLKNSDHSAPELIHSSEKKSDSCRRTGSGEATCVYNLLMRNLSSDDAGTYCCVVTPCGQILFGNGTRINIHRDIAFTKSVDLQLSPTVIALMLSNAVLGMVTLVLVWALCKNHKEDPPAASRSIAGSLEGSQTGDAVLYAAVCSAPRGSSCRPAAGKYSRDTVVYSDVRHLPTGLTDL